QLSIVGGASITGILISLLDEKFYILISLLFFISFLILSIHKKLDNYKEFPKEPKEQNNNKLKLNPFFQISKQLTFSFIIINSCGKRCLSSLFCFSALHLFLFYDFVGLWLGKLGLAGLWLLGSFFFIR